MGKLYMGTIEVIQDSMEIRLKDLQRIEFVPNKMYNVIQQFFTGRKILPNSGLPAVQYVGPEHITVVGAFTYGELSFLEIEGKHSKIMEVAETNTFLCLSPGKDDHTYEEPEEVVEEIENIEETS